MEHIRTSKEILKEWVEVNMNTHTDWTGTRVETIKNCGSIDEKWLINFMSISQITIGGVELKLV